MVGQQGLRIRVIIIVLPRPLAMRTSRNSNNRWCNAGGNGRFHLFLVIHAENGHLLLPHLLQCLDHAPFGHLLFGQQDERLNVVLVVKQFVLEFIVMADIGNLHHLRYDLFWKRNGGGGWVACW